MKKLAILCIIAAVLILPLISACQSGERIPIPVGVLPSPTDAEAPDDIVFTPGGAAYRANVHQGGVENPWSPIPIFSANLTKGSETITVYYRPTIDTRAGELHTDIVIVVRESAFLNGEKLALYAVDVPEGINITRGGGAGLPGSLGVVLVVITEPDVAAGQYTFQIGIEIDGKDYGTIPCTVKVVKEE
jgi:hypothetical protein